MSRMPTNRRFKPDAQSKALGQMFKKARLDKGLSLGKMAERAGVGRRTIQQVEDGCFRSVSAERLEKMATLFGFKLTDMGK